MPEYQIRRDANGCYYQEPIYSEEELEDMEIEKIRKEEEEREEMEIEKIRKAKHEREKNEAVKPKK